MICIIGAINEEIAGIKQHITITKKQNINSATFYQGIYKNRDILVIRSGVGRYPAQRAVSDALKKFSLKYVVSIGFAGALNPELKVSDLILSDNIYFCSSEESLFDFKKVSLTAVTCKYNYGKKAEKLLAESGIKCKFGNILTISKVANSAKFKEWLGKNYPVLGVEMETASIARVMEEQKLPFLSLRAVSDEVSQSILQTGKFIDKNGKINKLSAGYYLLTHPSQIPCAIELKKNTSKAEKTLTKAVKTIIDSCFL